MANPEQQSSEWKPALTQPETKFAQGIFDYLRAPHEGEALTAQQKAILRLALTVFTKQVTESDDITQMIESLLQYYSGMPDLDHNLSARKQHAFMLMNHGSELTQKTMTDISEILKSLY